MTASIRTTDRRFAGVSPGTRLLGLAPLMRKDVAEWRHGLRVWVILVVTASFMGLAAANSAIANRVLTTASDAGEVSKTISLDPLSNFMAAVGSQISVVVAIFAAISLFIAEREHGTLTWVASKPVSRGAIWVSKWAVAAVVITVAAGLVPLLLTTAAVMALYGAVPAPVVAMTAIGIAASIVFIVAAVLSASTVVRNQAAVAGIGFAIFFLPSILAGFAPVDIVSWLPTSILPWAVGLAMGAPVGIQTPVVWAIATAGLGGFAIWRIERLEL